MESDGINKLYRCLDSDLKKEAKSTEFTENKFQSFDRIPRNFAIGNLFSNLNIKELFMAKVLIQFGPSG